MHPDYLAPITCDRNIALSVSVYLPVRSRISTSSAVAEMGDRARAKWAEIWGGCCVPFRGGAGFPSNTMSLGPRPTSKPSGTLIHPGVWLQ